MKKSILLIAGLTLLLFAWTNTALAADKIGFINMQTIIQNSNAGKKAAEDFKKLFARKQENIKSMENEVKKLKDELDKQGAVMTASARGDKETAYQRKMRDYQILVDDTNKELQKRDQEYSQQLIPEILKVVRAIAEKEKYTVIMDISTMPLPYFDKAGDISKKVIDDFNKTSGAKKVSLAEDHEKKHCGNSRPGGRRGCGRRPEADRRYPSDRGGGRGRSDVCLQSEVFQVAQNHARGGDPRPSGNRRAG